MRTLKRLKILKLSENVYFNIKYLVLPKINYHTVYSYRLPKDKAYYISHYYKNVYK